MAKRTRICPDMFQQAKKEERSGSLQESWKDWKDGSASKSLPGKDKVRTCIQPLVLM